MTEQKRGYVNASDELYVKAMASPHYTELRNYLSAARAEYFVSNYDGPEYQQQSSLDEWFDLAMKHLPESLSSKYPELAKKASGDPESYKELSRFLYGKQTSYHEIGDKTVTSTAVYIPIASGGINIVDTKESGVAEVLGIGKIEITFDETKRFMSGEVNWNLSSLMRTDHTR